MTVIGPDVSHWQGLINWGQMASAGAQFVIVRAGSIDGTTGKCYVAVQAST